MELAFENKAGTLAVLRRLEQGPLLAPSRWHKRGDHHAAREFAPVG
jgi:hypothetical protein